MAIDLTGAVDDAGNLCLAEEADLILGDLVVPDSVDAQKYLDDTQLEIEVHLGMYYVALPAPLPSHICKGIKLAHQRMASGRLIQAMRLGAPDLNEYAEQLYQQGYDSLIKMLDNVFIEGSTTQTNGKAKYGLIINADGYSLVDTFDQIIRGDRANPVDGYPAWMPGNADRSTPLDGTEHPTP